MRYDRLWPPVLLVLYLSGCEEGCVVGREVAEEAARMEEKAAQESHNVGQVLEKGTPGTAVKETGTGHPPNPTGSAPGDALPEPLKDIGHHVVTEAGREILDSLHRKP
jgi:hypothetical protein